MWGSKYLYNIYRSETGKKMLMGGIISKVKDYIFGKLSENSNTSHSPMNPNTSNHSMAHNSNVNIRRSHSYSYEEEYEGDNSHV